MYKQVKATQRIDENESKKDALSKARDFGNSNPVALERSVGECFPINLAHNPEMKAVSYAGTTFGRCSIIYFFQSRGSLFFLSCSCHHLPEVLCIELTGNVFESKIYGMSCVPYNKLLTNLACSSRTGEYWPSFVFVRMLGPYCHDLGRANIPQYGPSARLVITT